MLSGGRQLFNHQLTEEMMMAGAQTLDRGYSPRKLERHHLLDNDKLSPAYVVGYGGGISTGSDQYDLADTSSASSTLSNEPKHPGWLMDFVDEVTSDEQAWARALSGYPSPDSNKVGSRSMMDVPSHGPSAYPPPQPAVGRPQQNVFGAASPRDDPRGAMEAWAMSPLPMQVAALSAREKASKRSGCLNESLRSQLLLHRPPPGLEPADWSSACLKEAESDSRRCHPSGQHPQRPHMNQDRRGSNNTVRAPQGTRIPLPGGLRQLMRESGKEKQWLATMAGLEAAQRNLAVNGRLKPRFEL